ncbi:hypothetical protein F4801DRAFT_582356 [Xylaria longipes]|nr:hypothetical protein F4801DRAFT_582356 [Xylaria longipes]
MKIQHPWIGGNNYVTKFFGKLYLVEESKLFRGLEDVDSNYRLDHAFSFNEINFGYPVDGHLSDSQLLFESTCLGKGQSIKVDTRCGNLYDEAYHNATLEYNSERVAFYLDDKLLQETTITASTPTDPMDLVLSPRLVTGEASGVPNSTTSLHGSIPDQASSIL